MIYVVWKHWIVDQQKFGKTWNANFRTWLLKSVWNPFEESLIAWTSSLPLVVGWSAVSADSEKGCYPLKSPFWRPNRLKMQQNNVIHTIWNTHNLGEKGQTKKRSHHKSWETHLASYTHSFALKDTFGLFRYRSFTSWWRPSGRCRRRNLH